MSPSSSLPQADLELTRVNGLGLWDSWTRNFRTPLLALLDLMDNACDAAVSVPTLPTLSCSSSFQGKIHVLADGANPSGLCLLNNSARRIQKMSKILEVYHSTKGSFAHSVGENGVGLKQGVAALTDLGFVLVRNERELSLGIIAKDLQQEQGCCLPSYELGPTYLKGVSRATLEAICTQHSTIQYCVQQYGEGDLQRGMDRLIRQFDTIVNGHEWKDEKHVFLLAIHKLKHGDESCEKAKQEEDSKEKGASSHPSSDSAVRKLMNELREELPRHYLHIPSSFDMKIDRHSVQFEYFQRRLVELTAFRVNVVRDELFSRDKRWKEMSHRDAQSWYTLNVYCGFDPQRSISQRQSAASMLIYSRRSGRLVCTEQDARAALGLSSGGTQFCQGLTIVVDDIDGQFPLNPTKQDIAFGEEKGGDIHKKNLFAWVGATAWLYWMKNNDACGESKELLSRRIQEAYVPGDSSANRIGEIALHDCKLTSFKSRVANPWTVANRSQSIRLYNRRDIQVFPGDDTIWRIDRDQPPGPVKLPAAKSVQKKQVGGKRKHTDGGAEASARERSLKQMLAQEQKSRMQEKATWAKERLSLQRLAMRRSTESQQRSSRAQPTAVSPSALAEVQSRPSGEVLKQNQARKEQLTSKIAELEHRLKNSRRINRALRNENKSLREQLEIAKEGAPSSDDDTVEILETWGPKAGS